MDSLEIVRILKQDRFTKHYFRGVFACDQLPTRYVPRPSAFVVNTDPSNKPGQHWVAIYITQNGEGEYFDSYGQRPTLPPIKSFLKKNATSTTYNHRPLQGPLSAVCGQYTIFFLLQWYRGLSMSKIIRLFSSDKMDNDIAVNDSIRKQFPRAKTSVYDESFLLRQISRSLFKWVNI